MAIDSRQKRTSVANYLNRIMPLADGTIGQADREHAAGLYMGITPSAPPTPPTIISSYFVRREQWRGPGI